MPATRSRWAAETEIIRRLEAEWESLAESPRLRHRLQEWAKEDPRLTFVDGSELLEATRNQKTSKWTVHDQVLAALLRMYPDDPLARRVALQMVLPQIKNLINRIRGWDTEERAARVVAAAVEVLAHCATEPAGTSLSYRVFSNTRKRVVRAALRARREPLDLSPDLTHLEDVTSTEHTSGENVHEINELIRWIQDKGGLPEETARLVVLTRAGGVSVRELAMASDVSAQTMRRQRQRAEQRLRRGLSIGR